MSAELEIIAREIQEIKENQHAIIKRQDEIISILNESVMPSKTDQIREIVKRFNQGDKSALKDWNNRKKKEFGIK